MPFSFQNLFIEHINELYSAEQQVVKVLPSIISEVASNELRDALDHYLVENQEHMKFLEACFLELKISPSGDVCKPIEGIIEEINEIKSKGNSPIKDAALIGMVQRLMHFKIAVYGTARTFARHLNYHSMDNLQRALNNEEKKDKYLTRLAEGGMFTTGINEEACRSKQYFEA